MENTKISSSNASGHNYNNQPLPSIIQEFFWKQSSPFIRPKFGKHHEATCTFCQNAHLHNDMKEACKIFEKVLVQNLPINNVNVAYKVIQKAPRWKVIEAAFPHIVHCVASFLQYRKDVMDLQTVSQTESKLLYILHWLILDAADECADSDIENGTHEQNPHSYIFSIPELMLFIYMLAPVAHRIKESELHSYRLENGLKLWNALWEYRHPDAACFTTYCKVNPHHILSHRIRSRNTSFDVFPGRKISEEDIQIHGSPQSTFSYTENQAVCRLTSDQSDSLNNKKTLIQEYSDGSGEHTVILRMPSLQESEDASRNSPVVFSGKASILQLSLGRNIITPGRASLPSEHLQLPPDISNHLIARHSITTPGFTRDREITFEVPKPPKLAEQNKSKCIKLHAATIMDVAVLRCLFIHHWPEEGVFWSLNFIHKRLQIMHKILTEHQPRKRSNSLPAFKSELAYDEDVLPRIKNKTPKLTNLKSEFVNKLLVEATNELF